MARMATCDLCGSLGFLQDFIRIGSSAGETPLDMTPPLDLCLDCSKTWLGPVFKERSKVMIRMGGQAS